MESQCSRLGGSGPLDNISDAHIEWLLKAAGSDVKVASLVLGVTQEELHARLDRPNGKSGLVFATDNHPGDENNGKLNVHLEAERRS